MLSPISMSPASTTLDYDDYDNEIIVSTSSSSPTPQPTVRQILEKTKFYVEKVTKNLKSFYKIFFKFYNLEKENKQTRTTY